MKKITNYLIMITAFCLFGMGMSLGSVTVTATGNTENAPIDWAFDESSMALNNELIRKYPGLNNGDGFVTKTAAAAIHNEISCGWRNITGTMNGIGNFSNTNYVELSFNQLSGKIPAEIENLTKVSYLGLKNNQLTGEIPAEIGNLANLQSLFLHYNQLSGEIPAEIGNLTNLRRLYLGNNQLSGEIPTEIGNLVDLQDLSLTNNQLSGEIPTEIGNLTNLKQLLLSNNHFTSVPDTVYDYALTMKKQGKKVELYSQTYTVDQPNPTENNKDYEFAGLPIYEQILSHGGTIQYTLQLPDGTSKAITPIISNGNVTIPGNEIAQEGNYSLTAIINDTLLDNSVYTTNFRARANESIKYIAANANGKKDVETSTKIAISLSKVPEVGELTKDDIQLTAKSEAIKALNMGNVTALGNGQYEIEITGKWEEGSIVGVELNKNGVIFDSKVKLVSLHEAVSNNNNNTDGNSNTNGNNNTTDKTHTGSIQSKAPLTGDSSNRITMIVLLLIILVSGSFLIIRKCAKK